MFGTRTYTTFNISFAGKKNSDSQSLSNFEFNKQTVSLSIDCLQSACIQCCTDPTCEPHREARETLRKTQSILNGTDAITRMATAKRHSKVAKGAFKDANIQYFGETVVIWNVREFMSVTKWREDAVRRSKRKFDSLVDGGRSKKRGRRSNDHQGDGDNNESKDEVVASLASKKSKKKSRRKKFAEMLQNSLNERGAMLI